MQSNNTSQRHYGFLKPPMRNRDANGKSMQSTSRRTSIESNKGDKRYVRRKQKGGFKTKGSVGRSLAIDRPHTAKNEAPKDQRDRGD